MKNNRDILAKLRSKPDLLARLKDSFKIGNHAVIKEVLEFCDEEIKATYENPQAFQLAFLAFFNFAKKADNINLFIENFDETLFSLVAEYYEKSPSLGEPTPPFAVKDKAYLFYAFSLRLPQLLDARYNVEPAAVFEEKKKAFLDSFENEVQREKISKLIYYSFDRRNTIKASQYLFQNIIDEEDLADVFYHFLMKLDETNSKRFVDLAGNFDNFFDTFFDDDLIKFFKDKAFTHKIIAKLKRVARFGTTPKGFDQAKLSDIDSMPVAPLSYEELVKYFSECTVVDDGEFICVYQRSSASDIKKIKYLISSGVAVNHDSDGIYRFSIDKKLFNKKLFLCRNSSSGKLELVMHSFFLKQITIYKSCLGWRAAADFEMVKGVMENYVVSEEAKKYIMSNIFKIDEVTLELKRKIAEEKRVRDIEFTRKKEEAKNKIEELFQGQGILALIVGATLDMKLINVGIKELKFNKKDCKLIINRPLVSAIPRAFKLLEFKKINGLEIKKSVSEGCIALEFSIINPDLILKSGFTEIEPEVKAEEAVEKVVEVVEKKSKKNRSRKRRTAISEIMASELAEGAEAEVVLQGLEESKESSQEYEEIITEEAEKNLYDLKTDIIQVEKDIVRHRSHNAEAKSFVAEIEAAAFAACEKNILFLKNELEELRTDVAEKVKKLSDIKEKFISKSLENEEVVKLLTLLEKEIQARKKFQEIATKKIMDKAQRLEDLMRNIKSGELAPEESVILQDLKARKEEISSEDSKIGLLKLARIDLEIAKCELDLEESRIARQTEIAYGFRDNSEDVNFTDAEFEQLKQDCQDLQEASEIQLARSEIDLRYRHFLAKLNAKILFGEEKIAISLQIIAETKAFIKEELKKSALNCGSEVEELKSWWDELLREEKLLEKFCKIDRELARIIAEKKEEFARYQQYKNYSEISFDDEDGIREIMDSHRKAGQELNVVAIAEKKRKEKYFAIKNEAEQKSKDINEAIDLMCHAASDGRIRGGHDSINYFLRYPFFKDIVHSISSQKYKLFFGGSAVWGVIAKNINFEIVIADRDFAEIVAELDNLKKEFRDNPENTEEDRRDKLRLSTTKLLTEKLGRVILCPELRKISKIDIALDSKDDLIISLQIANIKILIMNDSTYEKASTWTTEIDALSVSYNHDEQVFSEIFRKRSFEKIRKERGFIPESELFNSGMPNFYLKAVHNLVLCPNPGEYSILEEAAKSLFNHLLQTGLNDASLRIVIDEIENFQKLNNIGDEYLEKIIFNHKMALVLKFMIKNNYKILLQFMKGSNPMLDHITANLQTDSYFITPPVFSPVLPRILAENLKVTDEKDPEADFLSKEEKERRVRQEELRLKQEAEMKVGADFDTIMKIVEANKKAAPEKIERSSLSNEDDNKISIINDFPVPKKTFYKNHLGLDGVQSFTAHIEFDLDEINVAECELFLRRNEISGAVVTNSHASQAIGLSCKWENFDIIFSARQNSKMFEASEAAAEVRKKVVEFGNVQPSVSNSILG